MGSASTAATTTGALIGAIRYVSADAIAAPLGSAKSDIVWPSSEYGNCRNTTKLPLASVVTRSIGDPLSRISTIWFGVARPANTEPPSPSTRNVSNFGAISTGVSTTNSVGATSTISAGASATISAGASSTISAGATCTASTTAGVKTSAGRNIGATTITAMATAPAATVTKPICIAFETAI